MTGLTSFTGRRKAFAAVAAASVVAIGSLAASGDATARSTTRAGWPHPSASSSARAAAATQGADLVIETVEVRDAGVDLAPKGDSAGDFFTFEERGYEPGTKNVIGRDAARCENGIRTFVCTGTFQVFGKGKIVIDGALFSDSDNVFAITGGTGDYAGVGGTMRIVDGSDSTSVLAFDFVR